jgi:hypothetical protein
MTNETTQEELRSFRERGVVIFDPRKLYINIIGKDRIGNAIVRYNEEIIGYVMTSGVRVNTDETFVGYDSICKNKGCREKN